MALIKIFQYGEGLFSQKELKKNKNKINLSKKENISKKNTCIYKKRGISGKVSDRESKKLVMQLSTVTEHRIAALFLSLNAYFTISPGHKLRIDGLFADHKTIYGKPIMSLLQILRVCNNTVF